MQTIYVIEGSRMHKNATKPSTYHQFVKYPLRWAQGTILADNDPFLETEAYMQMPAFTK